MLTEDYIHRIGRTARSTNTGTAYTFITNDNARHLIKLLEILRDTNQEISEDLLRLAKQSGYGGRTNSYQRNGTMNRQSNGVDAQGGRSSRNHSLLL
jgi:superfamily II DNA/RNA helicase